LIFKGKVAIRHCCCEDDQVKVWLSMDEML
jgi:hypothetical protein